MPRSAAAKCPVCLLNPEWWGDGFVLTQIIKIETYSIVG